MYQTVDGEIHFHPFSDDLQTGEIANLTAERGAALPTMVQSAKDHAAALLREPGTCLQLTLCLTFPVPFLKFACVH